MSKDIGGRHTTSIDIEIIGVIPPYFTNERYLNIDIPRLRLFLGADCLMKSGRSRIDLPKSAATARSQTVLKVSCLDLLW